ncbi:HU family DNA-binding protein [Pseudomarimonas salicorniae]|uniref:HU family DNA-binding protein n=1 Tax=Pseudomarimonas salicorniae TaxID=2933270 RepID=A0ABT0GLC7_9GAMM|nr:HU family DNA-binding protein [Lysobacter sp. CAU 1642]MCK7595355.1 HU family DNA-binding protein [Lysobacter sp. CAU 1642]
MAKAKKVAPKAAKPKAEKAAPKAPKPIKEVMTKSALVQHLAETSGVASKDVKAVMAALDGAILASVNKKGAGAFVLPGVLKITTQHVPATKARKGINPFTGEETTFKAKPATVKTKVRPLKRLKDAAV